MEPEVQIQLGRRVASLRVARDLTQEQLAERCDFTVKFISSIERGLVNLPLVSLATIAAGLAVSISELTFGIDGSPPAELERIEQLLAGQSTEDRAAIVRLLSAVADLTHRE